MNDYSTDGWHQERTLRLVDRLSKAIPMRTLTPDEIADLRRHLRSKRGREAVPLAMALNDAQFKALYSEVNVRPKICDEMQIQLLRRAGKLGAITHRLALEFFGFVAGQNEPALFKTVRDLAVEFVLSADDGGASWTRHEFRLCLIDAINRVRDPGSSRILAQTLEELPPVTLALALTRLKSRHARASRKVVLVMLAATKGEITQPELNMLADRFKGDPDFGEIFAETHHATLARLSLARKLPLDALLSMRLRDIRKHISIRRGS